MVPNMHGIASSSRWPHSHGSNVIRSSDSTIQDDVPDVSPVLQLTHKPQGAGATVRTYTLRPKLWESAWRFMKTTVALLTGRASWHIGLASHHFFPLCQISLSQKQEQVPVSAGVASIGGGKQAKPSKPGQPPESQATAHTQDEPHPDATGVEDAFVQCSCPAEAAFILNLINETSCRTRSIPTKLGWRLHCGQAIEAATIAAWYARRNKIARDRIEVTREGQVCADHHVFFTDDILQIRKRPRSQLSLPCPLLTPRRRDSKSHSMYRNSVNTPPQTASAVACKEEEAPLARPEARETNPYTAPDRQRETPPVQSMGRDEYGLDSDVDEKNWDPHTPASRPQTASPAPTILEEGHLSETMAEPLRREGTLSLMALR